MSALALFVFVAGLIGLIYYWQFFDTSVAVPETTAFGQTLGGGRVHNIGLMQQKQNGMIVCGVGAAIGLILGFALQSVGKKK